MSFHFSWPRFSDQFHEDATQMLNAALNKGPKPRIIADKIEVVELEMGTQPPELEIRDIGEITTDQFRGIFRLSYAGDAHIVLRTKVQANPLNHKKADMDVLGSSRGILAAHQPLVVPMLLRLSHFRLNAYIVLVVSKQKGITLVFKTDPLQNVDVNSTFDSIAVIQKFIQKEIEGQLREMFREDLPGIIHRLSQKWTAGKTKVEAPYLQKAPAPHVYEPSENSGADHLQPPPLPPHGMGIMLPHPVAAVGLRPMLVPRPMSLSDLPHSRPRTLASRTLATSLNLPRKVQSPPSPPESVSSHPDLEFFDPTYGLRPESLPTKSEYSGFGKLFARDKGLTGLNEDREGASVNGYTPSEAHTFDMVDWDDAVPDFVTQASSIAGEAITEYESLPAVGGGSITRPRVYHSQSQIQVPTPGENSLGRAAPSSSGRTHTLPARNFRPHPLSQSFTSQVDITPAERLQEQDSIDAWRTQTYQHGGTHNPYFPPIGVAGPSRHPLGYPHTSDRQSLRAPQTPGPAEQPRRMSSSSYTHPSGSSSGPPHTVSTPPSTDIPTHEEPFSAQDPNRSPGKYHHERRRSLSPSAAHPFDSLRLGSPPRHSEMESAAPAIILRPNLNTTVQHLSALVQSNHTLSPYTHSPQHFAVRSGPPRQQTGTDQKDHQHGTSYDRKPVKAKRKRTFRLGTSSTSPQADTTAPSVPQSRSHSTPTEFSDDEVNRYFRSGESDHRNPPSESPLFRGR